MDLFLNIAAVFTVIFFILLAIACTVALIVGSKRNKKAKLAALTSSPMENTATG